LSYGPLCGVSPACLLSPQTRKQKPLLWRWNVCITLFPQSFRGRG